MAIKIPVQPSAGSFGRPIGSGNVQVSLRMQRVARMEIAGVSDRAILAAEKIDVAQLQYLRKIPEYIELRQDLLEGHLTEMDRAIAGKVDILRQEVRQAVPSALRCLIDAVNQRKDLRTALAAAGEILDRDPDRVFLKSKEMGGVAGDSVQLPNTIVENMTVDADKVAASINQKSNQKVN